MKIIIFLTYGISGCGGGQNHISNQIKYYQSKEYKTYVFYHLDGEVVMPFFKSYNSACQIKELNVPLNCYFNARQKSIINKIIKYIDFSEGDEIIIESNNIIQSMWGELLAKELSAKHFLYILGENDIIQSEDVYKYLRFKLTRKEIAGIVPKSIPNLFANFEEISENESYYLTASSGTWWEDYDVELIDSLPERDYNIGLFSRLEKPFVIPALTSLSIFINKHKELTFNIVVVGDSDNKNIHNTIKGLFSDIANANLVITGTLMPPPMRYVEKCDLCLGSSGCAKLSHYYGRLTISFDGNDNQPIGVMHFTTNESLFRNNEEVIPLGVWLEDIFIHRKYPFSYEVSMDRLSNYQYSEMHQLFIENSSPERIYYDMSCISSNLNDIFKGIRIITKWKFRHLVSDDFYRRLHIIKHRILQR